MTSQSSGKDIELNLKPIGDDVYVRSGLLGFLGPGGLVFVCGSRDGLMTVTGRKHNADDIIATVLAVEPMRFIYRGRIAVFSIKVLRDERVCVIAEQRPDCSEEESFQWMSRVLQAVDSIHQVGIYCLALVPPNHLPKTPLGGIHLCEARRRFLEGSLHPANVLMCPHTCVTNLPKPRDLHQGECPSINRFCITNPKDRKSDSNWFGNILCNTPNPHAKIFETSSLTKIIFFFLISFLPLSDQMCVCLCEIQNSHTDLRPLTNNIFAPYYFDSLASLYHSTTPAIINQKPENDENNVKGSLLQLCATSTNSETSVGPASVMVGNLVQGNRLAAAQGRDLGFTDDNKV